MGKRPRKSNTPRNHYDVGYGKPPMHARFQKGRSGNPKGRPKGRSLAEDMDSLIRSKLEARHATHSDGKPCERPLIDIAFDNLFRQFAKDPGRYLKQVMPLIEQAYAAKKPHGEGRDYGAEVRRKLDDMAEARRIAKEAADREVPDNASARLDRTLGDDEGRLG